MTEHPLAEARRLVAGRLWTNEERGRQARRIVEIVERIDADDDGFEVELWLGSLRLLVDRDRPGHPGGPVG